MYLNIKYLNKNKIYLESKAGARQFVRPGSALPACR